MSQCAALDALRSAFRDALLEDRFDEAAAIYAEEIAPDCEWVRRTSGGVRLRATLPEFVVEDEMRAMTSDEARKARIETAEMWRRIDWTMWIDARLTWESLSLPEPDEVWTFPSEEQAETGQHLPGPASIDASDLTLEPAHYVAYDLVALGVLFGESIKNRMQAVTDRLAGNSSTSGDDAD